MTHAPPLPDAAILTVAEVAAYLKLSPTTVWRRCKAGNLPAFRVGRQWRIERQDLTIWISALKEEAVVQDGPRSKEPAT